MMTVVRRKLMAVASGGGHWIQLLRLAPAFVDFEVVFVTVDDGYRSQVLGSRFYLIPDANRWDKVGLLRMTLRLAWILLKERPDAVVSTGAAPGYVALRIAHVLRAQTIWLDSIANIAELSLSGAKVGRYADLWLTQWPHLAGPQGPYYAGSVL
jgi:UDP-N-acetylglucosamine:LPS N-acetylglucosamine transferase